MRVDIASTVSSATRGEQFQSRPQKLLIWYGARCLHCCQCLPSVTIIEQRVEYATTNYLPFNLLVACTISI